MAVYTDVSAEALRAFLDGYAVGEPVMLKGIAEGVSNSNYLVETATGGTRTRHILTLYERRVDEASLPYVLALMEHLAEAGLPVPRPRIRRDGSALASLAGRPASLIEYLPGLSVSEPGAAHCHAVGAALGRLHLAAAGFGGRRDNPLGPASWAASIAALGGALDRLEPGLLDRARAGAEAAAHARAATLPVGTIHADLFPDNVLFLGTGVSGLIDFAFAGEDILAHDLAVAEAAWCFSEDGRAFDAGRSAALRAGYESVRPLSGAERAALPGLCAGAALRFLLSRAEDWQGNGQPGGPLVRHKDPLAFARRLDHYLAHALG